MLSVIKSKLKDRRDRQELSHLRVTMADIQKILSAEDEFDRRAGKNEGRAAFATTLGKSIWDHGCGLPGPGVHG